MYTRDYRDIIGGGVILLLGAFIALYALSALEIGTSRRMGPGFFPAGVGAILMLLGGGVMIPAFFRKGGLEPVAWRPLIAISGSLLAFSLVVSSFGLIPAIAASVAVSAWADSKLTLRAVVGLAACLSLICYTIFNLTLGLTLPMIRWPF